MLLQCRPFSCTNQTLPFQVLIYENLFSLTLGFCVFICLIGGKSRLDAQLWGPRWVLKKKTVTRSQRASNLSWLKRHSRPPTVSNLRDKFCTLLFSSKIQNDESDKKVRCSLFLLKRVIKLKWFQHNVNVNGEKLLWAVPRKWCHVCFVYWQKVIGWVYRPKKVLQIRSSQWRFVSLFPPLELFMFLLCVYECNDTFVLRGYFFLYYWIFQFFVKIYEGF